MSKSVLLKSSIAKKYWMAFTGLFLCLFLAGHLAGNLQLIFGTAQQFNEYARFMTTNPAVKVLSYITYFSILFHAVDGILLTIQNRKARPVKYVMQKSSANSSFASRNMAVLGTLILVFIVTHMSNFWAKMHFDKDMPLMSVTKDFYGQQKEFVFLTNGNQVPLDAEILKQNNLEFRGVDLYNISDNFKLGSAYKDLYKITIEFFKDPQFGLIATFGYALAMLVLAFHLLHGFQSAFQSIGVTHPTWTPRIKMIGIAFSIVVPLLFAIIPIYIHFVK